MSETLLAFVVTWLCLIIALRTPLRRFLADTPNDRSLHTSATPRFGGLAILIGFLSSIASSDLHGWLPRFLLGYTALSVISAVDDRKSLSAPLRLTAHLIIAGLWLSSLDTPWIWYPVLLLLVCWTVNLNNFMDGADGLAGGMAAAGMIAYALVASRAGYAPDVAVTARTLTGATLAFLCFNFPPARVFMGDAGSIPLGFAAAAIGILGQQAGLWSPLFPLILYFPFLFDATLTLTRRALRGERIWQAHREHLYQKAILGGLTHRQMTLRAYGLMLICALLALLSRNFPIWIQTLIIAAQMAVGMAIAYRIESTFKQRKSPS